MKYDKIKDLIILGENNTGKTTLIYNYLNLKKENITTIGIDYYKKALFNNNLSILLNIYDTGNGLLYRNILESYIKKSYIIIIVGSSTRFIHEVFNFIHTHSNMNPAYISIIYNKYNNNDVFQFNEKNLNKYKPISSCLLFDYINVNNKDEVKSYFSHIETLIIKNTNSSTKLLPLNENKTIKSDRCGNCCIVM